MVDAHRSVSSVTLFVDSHADSVSCVMISARVPNRNVNKHWDTGRIERMVIFAVERNGEASLQSALVPGAEFL